MYIAHAFADALMATYSPAFVRYKKIGPILTAINIITSRLPAYDCGRRKGRRRLKGRFKRGGDSVGGRHRAAWRKLVRKAWAANDNRFEVA